MRLQTFANDQDQEVLVEEQSVRIVTVRRGIEDNIINPLKEANPWMQEAGLAKPKWPERIEVVDAFPMTASGKVQKFRLREWIAARLEAETGRSA